MGNATDDRGRALSEDVPAGYKRTEVGVIPEDWETKRLGEFCSTYSGGTPSTLRAEFYGGDIPWITSSDLNTRRIKEVRGRITREGFDSSASRMVSRGDIVFALYGATAGVVAVTAIDAAINQAVLAIIPKSCDSEYLFQCLESQKAQIVQTYAQGGQPNLSSVILRSLVVPIPPLQEQRAIAEALSDVDELLTALEALIAKKRAIKQATMQQLLTGKTRLPGFSGAWEPRLSQDVPVGYKRTEVGVIPEDWSVFSIGELFDYLRTASNSRADLGDTGVVAYVHYGDIHTRFHHFIDFSRDDVPRLLAGKSVTATPLRNGDLIVADASEDATGVGKSVEVKNLGATEAVSGLHTFLLRSKNLCVHDGYRGYILEKEPVKRQLRRLATGLKVFGISKQALRDVCIPLPPPAEQLAIAAVLSDMDAEITALERRRDKTHAVKQGMMQQLLTGRVRLVKSV